MNDDIKNTPVCPRVTLRKKIKYVFAYVLAIALSYFSIYLVESWFGG